METNNSPSPIPASNVSGSPTTAPKRRNWFAIALVPTIALAGLGGYAIAANTVEPEVVTETKTNTKYVEKIPADCHKVMLALEELNDAYYNRLYTVDKFIDVLSGKNVIDEPYALGATNAMQKIVIEEKVEAVNAVVPACNKAMN